MAKLYMWASFCFDLSLYLWVYASYIDYEGPLLAIFALVFMISLLLLALPSSYSIRGFKINPKKVEGLGYLKVVQLITFFLLMPILGRERLMITVSILVVCSILSWENQIKIYKQIKKQVSYGKIVNKMLSQTEKDMKNDALVGVAWRTMLPLLLWGLLEEDHTMINLLICLVIISLIISSIFKLYKNLNEHLDYPTIKGDFQRTLIRVMIATVILVVMGIVNPTNVVNYLIIGFIPSQFVNLVYRHTLGGIEEC